MPAKGTRTRTSVRAALWLTAGALTLAGCSSADGSTDHAATAAADSVTIDDAWVKAADEGMSAAFGVLANSSDHDVTVISASSSASTSLELHETVENDAGQMVMSPVEAGFVIPARGELPLEPGGDHIMFMGLTGPLVAGDDLTVTLTFSDDTTYDFTAPVKDYSGANETYEGDADMPMGSDS